MIAYTTLRGVYLPATLKTRWNDEESAEKVLFVRSRACARREIQTPELCRLPRGGLLAVLCAMPRKR